MACESLRGAEGSGGGAALSANSGCSASPALGLPAIEDAWHETMKVETRAVPRRAKAVLRILGSATKHRPARQARW